MKNIMDEMPKLSGKYRCEMVVFERFGDWGVMYKAIGAKGAVHLHISRYSSSESGLMYSGGLEYHYRSPPDYMKDKPPSHDECQILKCPCWHDGTSLYASEVYQPMFLRNDHEGIFRQLERDAERNFNPQSEE